jgi:acetyltransferase-like isoleucine patch superfamily enzyme
MIALFLTGSRQTAKNLANAVALVLVAPCAATAALERRLGPHRDAAFNFWSHVFALAPGLPGMYLRRAFYRMTLDDCTLDFFVGFGTIFTHRCARVEPGVYIGPYGLVGGATLRRGCLIGSRVSIVSGRNLHELQADGTWGPARMETLQPIEVGEHCWIGEASTIVANIGRGALVGAGSVVAAAVPAGVMVAGNPARFIRVLQPPAARPAPVVEKVYAGGLRSVD